MRVCVVGSGVIGTIYGSTLTRAGTDVVHFVLPDADTPLREAPRSVCSMAGMNRPTSTTSSTARSS